MSAKQTKPAYWLGMTAFGTVHWYSGEWNPSLNIAACGAKSSGNTVPYIKHGRYSVCRDCVRKLARRGVIVIPQLHAAIAEYKEFYKSSTGFGVTSDRQQNAVDNVTHV